MIHKPKVEENIGLVHLCVKKFIGKGCEYDDLFQAGCVGLVKAAENFDTDRGVKFSTYAVPVILGEIRRLFREGTGIKVSRSMQELSKRSRETMEKLTEEAGASPSISRLAEELGISVEKTALALSASVTVMSLYAGEDGEAMEIPVDAPEERMTEHITLLEILSELEERDRRLLSLRYYENKTQADTAKALGMTQVQVSRREKKLLLMIREKFG